MQVPKINIRNHFSRIDVVLAELILLFEGKNLPNFFVEYNERLENDIIKTYNYYIEFFAGFKNRMTPSFSIDVRYNNDLTFNAFAEINPYSRQATYSLNKGLIYGLDDLFMRSACNAGFFSEDFSRIKVWNGTTCLFPIGMIFPKYRYLDYQIVERTHQRLESEKELTTELNYLYSGIPYGDISRMELANKFSLISMFWVLFHEEAHYWLGHLIFQDKNEFDVKSEYVFSEDKVSIQNSDLNKIMEWEADRMAIRSLTSNLLSDIFNPRIEYRSVKEMNDLCMNIRLVATACGAVTILFQKNRMLNGNTDFYPKSQTRLLTIFYTIIEKCKVWFKPFYKTNSEINLVIKEIVYKSFLDLYVIEQIITEDTVFEDGIVRTDIEKEGKKNIGYITFFRSKEELEELINSLIYNKRPNDSKLDNVWTNELIEIVNYYEPKFRNMFRKYRKMMSLEGLTPYHDD